MNQPKVMSNSSFVASGIYPGGAILVRDFCYKLWDYNGTQPPNSNLAVFCLGEPIDGSNDGKPVEIYWNVGSAHDFQPVNDGAFCVSGTKEGMGNSSNWHFVYEKFMQNCGLKGPEFDGPNGIRAMIGSQLMLARMPQPVRAGLKEEAPAPGQEKKRSDRDILVPTRAKFAWEGQGTPMQAQAPAPVAVPAPVAAQAPAQAAWPVQAPVAALTAPAWPVAAPVNGAPATPMAAPAQAPAPTAAPPAGDDMSVVAQAIANVLAAAPGPMEVSKLWMPVISQLAHIPAVKRSTLASLGKDNLEALVVANNWRYDGTYIARQ